MMVLLENALLALIVIGTLVVACVAVPVLMREWKRQRERLDR